MTCFLNTDSAPQQAKQLHTERVVRGANSVLFDSLANLAATGTAGERRLFGETKIESKTLGETTLS